MESSGAAVYEIRADVEKNRLYITMLGYLEDVEVARIAEQLTQELRKLGPNFTLLSDVRELHPSHPESIQVAVKLLRLMKLRGMGRAVRVSRIALSRIQLERSAQEAGVLLESAASLEEAEQMLESGI